MISICIVIGSARQGITALHAAAIAPLPMRRRHRSDACRLPTMRALTYLKCHGVRKYDKKICAYVPSESQVLC